MTFPAHPDNDTRTTPAGAGFWYAYATAIDAALVGWVDNLTDDITNLPYPRRAGPAAVQVRRPQSPRTTATRCANRPGPVVKARSAFTLEIDVERYARAEGIDFHRVRADAFA